MTSVTPNAPQWRAPWRGAPGEPVVIYGAGNFARAVIRALRAHGAEPRYALDERAESIGTVEGIAVHAPGREPVALADRGTLVAVVAVFNRDASLREIESSLRAAGYGRIVGPAELYEAFSVELGERFWLGTRAKYLRGERRITLADELWSDEASRELYRSLLRYRLTWDASALPARAVGRQYFPADLPPLESPLTFVDCGAYTGDTLRDAHEDGVRIADVYAFEPDPTSFATLAETARALATATGARAALWPCAVSARTGRERFAAAAGEASRLSEQGGDEVPTVALDDAIPGVAPSYLKMDIEGAELAALRGAEGVIRRSRPRLAICVYHCPDHLWEIPLYVRDLGLSYDLHLRCHGDSGFDVVLYAVPRRSE